MSVMTYDEARRMRAIKKHWSEASFASDSRLELRITASATRATEMTSADATHPWNIWDQDDYVEDPAVEREGASKSQRVKIVVPQNIQRNIKGQVILTFERFDECGFGHARDADGNDFLLNQNTVGVKNMVQGKEFTGTVTTAHYVTEATLL